jgi:hypothetical protein
VCLSAWQSIPPAEPPLALTAEFGTDPTKLKQWEAFVRKGKFRVSPAKLQDVLILLDAFLMPPSRAAAAAEPFNATWPAGGSWTQELLTTP